MATKADQSPERLDLEEQREGLIVSEHQARYLWGAQLAEGRQVLDAGCGTGYGLRILEDAGASRVVGVDVSDEAVQHASKVAVGDNVDVFQADLRELPFSDGEFDLVVCFEVIEHVEDREAILDELSRVAGTDGILCISTPNRRVYPPGNPHHLHEYEPEEFEAALGERFANVSLYRQTAWLASAILADTESAAWGSTESLSPRAVKTAPRSPGEETFTIALAGQRELPSTGALLTLGEPFEVRWWEAQLDDVALQRRHERAEQGRVMLAVESELATAQSQIAQLRITLAEVKEWAADQMKQKVREQVKERDELEQQSEQIKEERRDYENRLSRAERTIDDITGSLSWRITSPLRRVKRLLGGG